ncbi:MAG: hypothetical protein AAF621_00485 [Pseudomonadota bacterium]
MIFDLDIKAQSVQKLLKDFPLDETKISAAHNAALRKTGTYLNRISVKELSTELQLAISILKSRIKRYRLSSVGKTQKLKIFFGLNAIPMAQLDPEAVTGGVKAGPAFAQKAFIARIQRKAKPGVYKRKGKRRFPVQTQYYHIHVPSLEKIEEISAVSALQGWHGVYIREFERNLIWRSRQ